MSRLCIGVTGHRSLAEPGALERRVEEALRRLDRGFARAGLPSPDLTVASSLAEGADRLVPRMVLRRPGARLLALLPLRPEDYRTDFSTVASREEFDRLLALAEQVLIGPPAPSRQEAYTAAGLAVLDRCQVLFALWDGLPARGPGGTGELVAQARARELPLIWIRSEAPYTLRGERLGRIVRFPQPDQDDRATSRT